jgi:hypothetical protein
VIAGVELPDRTETPVPSRPSSDLTFPLTSSVLRAESCSSASSLPTSHSPAIPHFALPPAFPTFARVLQCCWRVNSSLLTNFPLRRVRRAAPPPSKAPKDVDEPPAFPRPFFDIMRMESMLSCLLDFWGLLLILAGMNHCSPSYQASSRPGLFDRLSFPSRRDACPYSLVPHPSTLFPSPVIASSCPLRQSLLSSLRLPFSPWIQSCHSPVQHTECRRVINNLP